MGIPRFLDEAGYVEDGAEGDDGGVVPDVPARREHGQNGYAVGDVAQVDHIHERHHVIVCQTIRRN